MRWLRRFPIPSRIALGVLAVVVLTALIAPLLAPHDPYEQAPTVEGPSADHWMGQDSLGRDILSRLMHGARWSLAIGLGATLLALLAGAVLGAIAATSRRAVDEAVMRGLDVVMAFPGIALAAVLIAVFGGGVPVLICAIAFLNIPPVARVVRANVMAQYGEDYVVAERIIGARTPHILIRHVAINCAAPVLVFCTVMVAEAIVFEASLSFIGAGVRPPEPSWGSVIADGKNMVLLGGWWATVFPGLLMLVTVLSLNILSESLSDTMALAAGSSARTAPKAPGEPTGAAAPRDASGGTAAGTRAADRAGGSAAGGGEGVPDAVTAGPPAARPVPSEESVEATGQADAGPRQSSGDADRSGAALAADAAGQRDGEAVPEAPTDAAAGLPAARPAPSEESAEAAGPGGGAAAVPAARADEVLVGSADGFPFSDVLAEAGRRLRRDEGVRAGEPVLAVDRLVVGFGDTDIVAGVSFEVRPGEVLGVVGESGCGKTLTALTVMGLQPREARIGGSVRFQGRELLGLKARERRRLLGHEMAMVYQDALSSLNPAMPIRAQLRQLVRRGGRRTPAELLELVGLDPERVLRSYPHELSGGQRQRVLIAMALSRDPRLIVADEPTTALDVTVQAQVIELLLRLREELGFALILVSHDLALVADVTDRVAVMYGGHIVETGVTADLVAAPAHHYTRGLLGSVLSLEATAERMTQIPGVVPSPADFPPGCRFADRCPFADAECAAVPPERPAEGPGHLVLCHHPAIRESRESRESEVAP
ncbi:dipeptide/oligopeptide/nickel ABC transporter permease/ATP-binding protein [Streptomyces sp. 8K308]|uniref:dipeptide/oligopeptide/nickel ABC transporter permease/ATP-binding protein n=1 Tax=Streptomyces sp. 8K308 TaxID=2530388 RepID=UPI001FB83129|nr:dipeptide/oligopeptide/nickel ABC transporter permease/ATP-binding protein [Streptomyces sp. 8K308]